MDDISRNTVHSSCPTIDDRPHFFPDVIVLAEEGGQSRRRHLLRNVLVEPLEHGRVADDTTHPPSSPSICTRQYRRTWPCRERHGKEPTPSSLSSCARQSRGPWAGGKHPTTISVVTAKETLKEKSEGNCVACNKRKIKIELVRPFQRQPPLRSDSAVTRATADRPSTNCSFSFSMASHIPKPTVKSSSLRQTKLD